MRRVTHLFMKNDRVPQSAMILGMHFGRIVEPELEPPSNFSGANSDSTRDTLMNLAGLRSQSASGRVVMLARLAVDSVARHKMENYLGALVGHLPAAAEGFNPVGTWTSSGSFFQVSSNTAIFTLTANRRMLLNDEASILGQKARLTDNGWWQFSDRTLTLGVADAVTLRYELVAADGDRLVQWRRSEIEPNLQGLRASFERFGGEHPQAAAATAALMLRGASKLMRDKVVTWTKIAELPANSPKR